MSVLLFVPVCIHFSRLPCAPGLPMQTVDRSVSQEEADLLFEMFDFNHDGVLTYDELIGAVKQLQTRSAFLEVAQLEDK